MPVTSSYFVLLAVAFHFVLGTSADKIGRQNFVDILGRPFRIFVLDNGLRVLLLHEGNARFARASLRIAAGSMTDPHDAQGLAHFVEHAIFLGNEKFPKPYDFYDYINANGGYLQGTTLLDNMAFEFAIGPEQIEHAMEHLSAMVFTPIFNQTLVEKEVESVNSEFEKGLVEDGRKENRVLRITSKPHHPFRVFNIGNRETLTKPRDKLRKYALRFHRKYYVPRLTALVLMGEQPMDKLEELARKYFGNADGDENEVSIPRWEPAWGRDELRTITTTVPIEDKHELVIYFPVPADLEQVYTMYFEHLFERRCATCLYGQLDRTRWVRVINSGVLEVFRYFNVFSIEIQLTELGISHYEEIIQMLFQYIKAIGEYGPKKWFWDERHYINYAKAKYGKKIPAGEVVGGLSSDFWKMNPIKAILKRLKPEPKVPFNPKDVEEAYSYFTPQNVKIMISSQKVKDQCNLYDALYDVEYGYTHLSSQFLHKLENVDTGPMRFPKPVSSIPKRFGILKIPKQIHKEPNLVYDGEFSKVWHLQDTKFRKPMTLIRAAIASPYTQTTVSDIVMRALLHAVVDRCIDAWPTYHGADAFYVGTSVSLDPDGPGIQVNVEGFSDDIDHTLYKTMKNIATCKIDEDTFTVVWHKYRSILQATRKKEPCELADANMALNERDWTIEDKLNALEWIQISDLIRYQSRFLSQISITWLFYGNLNEKQAIKFAQQAEKPLIDAHQPIPFEDTDTIWIPRELQIPNDRQWLFRTISRAPSNHTCVKLVFQPNTHTTRDFVLISLLQRMITQPFLVELRTNQQLAYDVQVENQREIGYNSWLLELQVQGEHSPLKVEESMKGFIIKFRERIRGPQASEDFKIYAAGLEREWTSTHKDIAKQGEEFWREIVTNELKFQRRRRKFLVLESINVEHLQTFYDELFGLGGHQGRNLTFHVVPHGSRSHGYKEKRRIVLMERKSLARWKANRLSLPMRYSDPNDFTL